MDLMGDHGFNVAAYVKCKYRDFAVIIVFGVIIWTFFYNVHIRDATELTLKPSFSCDSSHGNLFETVMESVHQERIAALKRSCERTGSVIRNDTINKNLLYSKKYKLGACEIQKCGSSSWLRAISVMDGYYTLDDYLAERIRGKRLVKLSQNEMRFSSLNKTAHKEWQSSVKIITVRDPFSRIVSAYNGKLAPNGRGASTLYYKPISQRISAQFRHMRQNPADRKKLNDGMATFEDFVNYLVSTNNYDSHWRPYEDNCQPCLYKYDYIVKFETLDADMRYLENVLKISADDRKAFFPTGNWKTLPSLVENMFKEVPRSAALKLYRKLRLDFDRFGYAKPDWL